MEASLPAQDRFTELLERHRGIVLKVAASYARHREDRRELAQEIATQVWRAFPRYDASRPFSTWLFRIALNVAISFAREAGRRTETVSIEHEPEPADPAASPETIDARERLLARFLASLDPMNRALLLLYLEEASYQDMAEVLGITPTNVATKINRLKQRLRQMASSSELPVEARRWNSTT